MGIDTVAVIGAGTMGNGIAQVLAGTGHRVIMMDVADEALARGMNTIKSSLARVVKKERMTREDADAALARITPTTENEAVAGAGLFIEAATENPELKHAIFKRFDALLPPEVIMATNTSSISITSIGAATGRSDRVVGMHFFNPVPVMRLVEVIPGLDTSGETTAIVMDLARKLGKTPVQAKDSPGFVANRLLMPLINEAAFAYQEGVADAEAIDTVMKLGMAHPMGPLELADLVGLDVCLAICEVLHRDLGEDKYRPAPILRKLVAAGHLGRKSGRGFHRYD